MEKNVRDLRSGERWWLVESIVGSFGTAEVTVINVAEQGANVVHAQPLRLLHAFAAIEDKELRRSLVGLAEGIARVAGRRASSPRPTKRGGAGRSAPTAGGRGE